MMKSTTKRTLLKIALVIIVIIGTGIGLSSIIQKQRQKPMLVQDQLMTLFGETRPLPAFELVDHDGKVFDLARLKGTMTIIFFGYTSCPDICPTTLVMLDAVKKGLDKGRAKGAYQFVFVSVDPKRDKIAGIKPYVTHYNKEFIGVTGKADQIAQLASALGAMYEVLDNGTDNYQVNHTGSLFVINRKGEYQAIFAAPHIPVFVADRLEKILMVSQ